MIDTHKINQTVLSFDWGEKRIGVAIKLAGEINISPLATVEMGNNPWNQINYLIKKHLPDILVVGRPLNLEGEKTEQTNLAISFAQKLAKRTNLKVILQDETLTTLTALQSMPKKASQKQKKLLVDQLSAKIILEDYLNEV
ncbi:MAG: Holliday junction resolvase RuvX [bacterium]|nr:Holliday junction resolvase RuvX [bacterium]